MQKYYQVIDHHSAAKMTTMQKPTHPWSPTLQIRQQSPCSEARLRILEPDSTSAAHLLNYRPPGRGKQTSSLRALSRVPAGQSPSSCHSSLYTPVSFLHIIFLSRASESLGENPWGSDRCWCFGIFVAALQIYSTLIVSSSGLSTFLGS